MTSLRDETEFFREKQEEFARDHHGEYVVVHGRRAHGFHETLADAYEAAIQHGLEPGEFAIHHCVRRDEEKRIVFHSRVRVRDAAVAT